MSCSNTSNDELQITRKSLDVHLYSCNKNIDIATQDHAKLVQLDTISKFDQVIVRCRAASQNHG